MEQQWSFEDCAAQPLKQRSIDSYFKKQQTDLSWTNMKTFLQACVMGVYHTILHCRCVKNKRNEFLFMLLYKRIRDYSVAS